MNVKITGRRVEVPNQVLIDLNGEKYQFSKYSYALQTTSKIDSAGYALVQDKPLISQNGVAEFQASSAVSMAQMLNGKGNFFRIHRNAFENNLGVMDVKRFLPHLYNVNEALQGRGVLYDANGNLIEGKKLADYANILNHNSWVYLNGHFKASEEGREGFKGLDLLTITGFENKKPIFSRVPLQDCLENSCWADVTQESLNEQGFPTKKSPIGNKYEPGKIAYFRKPFDGSVARFYANSVRAYFYCYGDPAYRYDSLGVFASAEGASVAENKS